MRGNYNKGLFTGFRVCEHFLKSKTISTIDDHTLVTANKLNSKISEYNNVIQVLERHLKSESYSKNEVDKKKQETLIEFWTKMNNVGTTTDVKKVTSGVAFDAVIDYLKKELEKMETEFSKL